MNNTSYQELHINWLKLSEKIKETGNIIQYNPTNTQLSALDLKKWALKIEKLHIYLTSLTSKTLVCITDARMHKRARIKCPYCKQKVNYNGAFISCSNTNCTSNLH